MNKKSHRAIKEPQSHKRATRPKSHFASFPISLLLKIVTINVM